MRLLSGSKISTQTLLGTTRHIVTFSQVDIDICRIAARHFKTLLGTPDCILCP